MPPKRKTKKDDDGASKKKATPTEKEDATESKDDKVAADVAESRGDVHIISSKACQAFAKRHLELEASCDSQRHAAYDQCTSIIMQYNFRIALRLS